MLNDPGENPQKPRRVHPLEDKTPQPPDNPPPEKDPQRQRVTLHIPVVTPIVSYTLIGINIMIFITAFYLIPNEQLNQLYDWGANNQQAVLQFGEYHRLLSAMFLHGSLAHIAFNMYALFVIGQTVERFFGHVRFLVVYFLGGLAGSLLSVILNGPQVFSVGASGAVFAIFGAEMVFIYKHRKLLGEMGRAQLRQLIVIAGINFLFGFATSFGSAGVRIDNWGHVGGLIGGLAVAWMIGPVFLVKRHPENHAALITEDSNPLEQQYQPLLILTSMLLAVLIVATMLVRG